MSMKSMCLFLSDHFEALAKLIELNRRAGQLENCDPFLDQVMNYAYSEIRIPNIIMLTSDRENVYKVSL